MTADARYCCSLPRRLARVREHNAAQPAQALNGIDYLEIGPLDQRTLIVWCLLPPTGLTKAHCRIDGGVRITGIEVAADPGVNGTIDPGNQDYRVTLSVKSAGDFSDYTLRFIDPAAPDHPAPGFDPRLAEIDFSFKAQCPSDFDCASTPECEETVPPAPTIDYLAKDYGSFSELMLDRLGVLMPGFAERNAADLQVALVELLAYAGDHLSYYQDAVGTEAYLGTARSRVSLRRHARLLDYAVHDGCNARAWVTIEVDRNIAPIGAGTPLLTRGEAVGAALASADLPRQLDANTIVFETLHEIRPTPANRTLRFYAWSDDACWLPAGSTQATLIDEGQTLATGDVLILEEVLSPDTGRAQDADASHRWAVRMTSVAPSKDPLTGAALFEVAWGDGDALPFALCLSARIGDALVVTPDVTVARGNVVLADHGLTRHDVPLIPPVVPDSGEYRPLLPDNGVAFAVPFDALALAKLPASAARIQDPRNALPAGAALDGEETWRPQRDLLASNRFSTEFVVETENDGGARLRFGDGRNGMAPTPGEQLLATYRLGGGARGNVGPEAISRIVTDDAMLAKAVKRVRNPLPAAGGQDPESPEQVRQYAPQAFRVQERAVTEDDFARIAERYPGVQRAVARLRWTGSWHTVYISVDRRGGRSAARDAGFNAGLRAYVERFRLAGYDLEIRDPVYVPLDITLQVCVQLDRFAADVELALRRRFGTTTYDGQPAFFNPDQFSFGGPLYLSQLVKAALDVPGVASVKATVFQRWGKTASGELAAEVIRAEPLEVVRLDNDPNFPENGRIVFDMLGGL
jgi:hypothetical protein